MVPQRAAGLVLVLAAAGCATAVGYSDSSPILTVHNQTSRFVKLYIADTPRSVPERLGRLVIGEARAFRLRESRPQFLLVVFPDGHRISRELPAHRVRDLDVIIENGRTHLSLSYRN